jgi:MurNAc alpha-1-phosphate uridylyltransferase
MKAMILAAGRGERMRPLSDTVPKPLLPVGGRPLIVWQLERLRHAGITDIAINVAWLGAMVEAALGDGAAFGVRIRYSRETAALGTAGGIANALPLLGDAPFLAVSADVYCDYDFSRLRTAAVAARAGEIAAHLVMVNNPHYHPQGDFALAGGRIGVAAGERLTYANIGLYRPDFFAGITPGDRADLGQLLRARIARGDVSGERFDGLWMNTGTPDDLRQLDRLLQAS